MFLLGVKGLLIYIQDNMAGNTKNLGQVSGVHIGNTPPSNIVLIWYDNTPSQKRHKVYDPTLQQWVVLDQNIISAITYSELVNMAKNTGLSVGEWFQITDRSNALALAITSTKVQYSDAIGNILIDDLGTNIQYHVTSSNLSIDDVVGVFDEVNKKLVFQFNEYIPDYTSDDYVFGKVRRNNIWSLAKYKLSSFLSKVTGNSITWNGGFFFSFSNELKNVLDKKGGVVSKDTYDNDKTQLVISINNVGKENQNIIQNAQKDLTNATSDEAIYGKKLPSIATAGEAIDVAKGDTLLNIVAKFQRWVNKFKYATGIRLPEDFSTSVEGTVNNNDSVSSAISKLQNQANNISSKWLVLPEDFSSSDDSLISLQKGDSFVSAFSKIESDRNQAIKIQRTGAVSNRDGNLNYMYSVNNGTLTFWLYKNSKMQWKYFIASEEFDYLRFFPLNWGNNTTFIDALKHNMNFYPKVSENEYDAVSLVLFGRASCKTSENNVILAEVSFGYRNLDDNLQFGIILRPIMSQNDSQIKLAIPGTDSFYSMLFDFTTESLVFSNMDIGFQYKVW